MKYKILTLFPELFEPFKQSTLTSRAIENKLIDLELVQFRNYAVNTQGQIDDSPFGGGGGMVARIDACVPAIEDLKKDLPNAPVIVFSPRGQPIKQDLVKEITEKAQAAGGVVMFCSRYEGMDQRFIDGWVDYELCVGDAVYMGGEVPAMAFLEASARLIPGVLGNEKSIEEESFEIGGLEYPQYTKPREYRGHAVPDVLLSGNHGEIDNWRKNQSIVDTSLRRPDLLPKTKLTGSDQKLPPIYLGLVHYPVVDKHDKTVISSITNLDVHDIARSVKTFNLDGFFIIHPSQVLRKLIQKVCDHWSHGAGYDYNINRSEALSTILSVPSLDDSIREIEKRHGSLPRMVITSARTGPRSIEYDTFKELLPNIKEPIFLLFGTGWGIHQSVIDKSEYRLNPIWGRGDYNHLSVRSAVAIILDRLFGS